MVACMTALVQFMQVRFSRASFLMLSWSHLCSLLSLPDTVKFLLTGGGTGTTWRNQVAELSRDKVLPNFEGII
ncbi:hypothetical protein B9Z19DRAFT_1092390, partial [Tuber borchii]